jgi:TetR/AcrR family transcriptional repressor of lmrAB and yxaGH operons
MAEESSTGADRPGTRDRLIDAAAALFSRHGYAATGVKAVLAAADAPYGSLYHWFPDGKQQLGVAAVERSGMYYRTLVESFYPPGVDVVEATAACFGGAAELLEATDFADACPIATIALEVASTDDVMRAAAADAFESWLTVLVERFVAAGMSSDAGRDVAVQLFCLLEGAFLLARTTRSTGPLNTVGDAAARAVASGLDADRGRLGARRLQPAGRR